MRPTSSTEVKLSSPPDPEGGNARGQKGEGYGSHQPSPPPTRSKRELPAGFTPDPQPRRKRKLSNSHRGLMVNELRALGWSNDAIWRLFNPNPDSEYTRTEASLADSLRRFERNAGLPASADGAGQQAIAYARRAYTNASGEVSKLRAALKLAQIDPMYFGPDPAELTRRLDAIRRDALVDECVKLLRGEWRLTVKIQKKDQPPPRPPLTNEQVQVAREDLSKVTVPTLAAIVEAVKMRLSPIAEGGKFKDRITTMGKGHEYGDRVWETLPYADVSEAIAEADHAPTRGKIIGWAHREFDCIHPDRRQAIGDKARERYDARRAKTPVKDREDDWLLARAEGERADRRYTDAPEGPSLSEVVRAGILPEPLDTAVLGSVANTFCRRV